MSFNPRLREKAAHYQYINETIKQIGQLTEEYNGNDIRIIITIYISWFLFKYFKIVLF